MGSSDDWIAEQALRGGAADAPGRGVRAARDDAVMTISQPMTSREQKRVDIALATLEADLPHLKALATPAGDEDTSSIQDEVSRMERAVAGLKALR